MSLTPNARTVSLKKQAARVVLVLGAMALCGVVDYVTGIELSVFVLYAIPIAMATRFFGSRTGMAMSVLATGIWMAVDRLGGHQYSQAWIWYVNAFNRMACFVFAVWAISYFQAKQHALKQRIKAFNGPIPICTQCRRLGAQDGYWWQIESYLQEFGGAQPHHKVCPDCARHAYARGGYREHAEQGG